MSKTIKNVMNDLQTYGVVYKYGITIECETNNVEYILKYKTLPKGTIFKTLEDTLRVTEGILTYKEELVDNSYPITINTYKLYLPKTLHYTYLENININKGRGPEKVMRYNFENGTIS